MAIGTLHHLVLWRIAAIYRSRLFTIHCWQLVTFCDPWPIIQLTRDPHDPAPDRGMSRLWLLTYPTSWWVRDYWSGNDTQCIGAVWDNYPEGTKLKLRHGNGPKTRVDDGKNESPKRQWNRGFLKNENDKNYYHSSAQKYPGRHGWKALFENTSQYYNALQV